MSIHSPIPLSPATKLGLQGSAFTHESASWFDRAKRVLAGGISSSARSTTTGPLPYPLYMAHGRGSRIWDADGNQFIDYLISYGSVILGHADVETSRRLYSHLLVGAADNAAARVEQLRAARRSA